ncbi:class I SAM-dependent methyltransferase [Xylophilus sp. GOD-11R]|uniref:class I SAM-dependent methyltransferase n=1 Tax=Xylophilus sp. GOD-11R TaxID=3089814 RepID=UPI00298D2031|nr:class I SAM-dependent methyltransferase [Xylophilus sp. GOD-11R]WPB58191.1 class I SAM-dependent methyltransferase [Xylophilus sp. GOD-11R]
MHSDTAPSPWIVRWSHLVPHGATVLDLACGAGRHLRWFASRGATTLGIDRAPEAVATAQAFGAGLLADVEGAPWPLPGRRFDAVVVTNYLHRPLLPTIVEAVAPGGVLIYETFAQGQEAVGRPSRPDFLLAPGELMHACAGLHIVAYEDGWLDPPRRVQRIVARRAPADAAPAAPSLAETAPPYAGPLHPQG